jgi:hypothetical protein
MPKRLATAKMRVKATLRLADWAGVMEVCVIGMAS